MPNYLTVKQVAVKHSAFSESSIRYYIFHEKTNGLSNAIRRIGRKILINESLFLEWLESHKGV